MALLTPTVIANELLMRFQNNLGFAKNIDHDYNDKFAQEGAKIGDTFTLREGARFVANTGADITSQIQDVNETSKTLTLDQRRNVAFKFSTKDLTLTVDRFGERYLEPVAITLANAVDVYMLTAAYQATFNNVGTPGTPVSSALTFLQAGQKLDENSAPMDDKRFMVINPAMQTSSIDSLKGLFNSQKEIGKQYVKGRMGEALGFTFALDQNIRTHTVGAYVGTPLADGASQGASGSVLTKGWTGSVTGLLKKGDTVTFGSVYDVNPVSGDSYAHLKQFVLTADVNSTSGAATLPISSALVVSGPTKNASALIADNAPITVTGAASTASPQAMAFHKQAFVFAMAPLMMPNDTHTKGRAVDPDTGMSIRIVSGYNILTDDIVWRADILFGFTARRPEWAVRVEG